MATVRDLISAASGAPFDLDKADLDRLDLELLLCHCLSKPRTWLYSWPEAAVESADAEHFQRLVSQRRQGKPLAYLLGKQEFWSLPLTVNEHTLIPRADTETLVQWALALALPETACVVDLGTGSGAVALALARERPHWQLTATDCSEEALEVARVNASALGLARVSFLCSDWFQQLPGKRWNLMVSNPPYIPESDPHLHGDGVSYEPRAALSSGVDGLDDIRLLAELAPAYLASGGYLLMEHGFDQAAAVRALLSAAGFVGVESRRDLAGLERVSGGYLA